MKKMPDKLKNSAPEGTIWFGGPIDKSKVTLRIFGDDLNPDEISELLKCNPSVSYKKGDIIKNGQTAKAKTGRWSLESTLSDETDLEEKVWDILKRLSSDVNVWKSITTKYEVVFFCGVFLDTDNRGFGLSVSLMREISRLGIEIGFDIYAPEKEL
jgi:ribosomal protein L19